MAILDKKFGGQFEGVVAYIYELSVRRGRQCLVQVSSNKKNNCETDKE
jgi:hypothetical protein